ncbi:hypothetical protein TrRE_jg9403 [Triparma retinervis]|uniref:Endonuclease/exonuclease/phosphatase domain-containing protein n=1 Tax=Triparma retinervis TaxID=2557542 RepID=A0A9W7AP77_9STRA|nr:hypothetical protein TrRE_jg9403 [Triparma retinervis]
MCNNACKNDFLLGRSLGRSQSQDNSSSCSDDEENDSYCPSEISESDPIISLAPLDDHIKTELHKLPKTHWASPYHTDNDAKETSALKPEIDIDENTTLHELPPPQGVIAQIANPQGELVKPPPTTTVTPPDHNNDSQTSSQASSKSINANHKITTVTYNLSAIKGCRRQVEVDCRMEAVGKIINTYKPFAVCTQELSRELQQALYPHINDDYNCYEGTFASSLPLNQHTRGCANGIMLRSDAKFVKGGTVHFRTTTMGYDFIFAIVEIADGEEALILNTHLESHHKVTDEDGNRKNNVMYTGVFAREDQIGQLSSFVKGYTENRREIKFVILHGDMNWDDRNANGLYIERGESFGCDEDLVKSLGDNWVDAWLEVQDPTDHKRDAGYTYDSTIPFNGGSYSVRKRLDRILFWQRPEKEGGSHLQTTNCVVVKQSKENVKERTEWAGEKYLNDVVMPPSDHFAVLATFDYSVAS